MPGICLEGLCEGVDVGLILRRDLALREGKFLKGLQLISILEGLVIVLGGGGEGHVRYLLDQPFQFFDLLIFSQDNLPQRFQLLDDDGLEPAKRAGVGFTALCKQVFIAVGFVGVVAEGVLALEGEVVAVVGN